MSRQKAVGPRGDTALSATKRYVGGRACYHQFPRMSPLGSSLIRGNGAALSGNWPGIHERRGKDSNLRGLSPIAHPPARPPPGTTTRKSRGLITYIKR